MNKKTKEILKRLNQDKLQRHFSFNREHLNEKERTVEIAFSSETTVQRWFGGEILGHKSNEIRMDFLSSGSAPLLMDHNSKDQIGVIEKAHIDSDLKGRATVRFGKSKRAEEMFQDVKDGIRKNISVGYKVHDMTRVEEDVYRMTDWEPNEISLVSVPADTNVGIGRNEDKLSLYNINEETQGEVEMPPKDVQKAFENNADKTQTRSNDSSEVKIDTESITNEVRKQEVERINQIRSLSCDHNVPELGDKAIRDGISLNKFQSSILDYFKTDTVRHSEPQLVGLNKKESENFSLLRALDAIASGDWSKAGFEREASKEAGRLMGKEASKNSFFIPNDIAWNQGKRATQVAGTDNAGGYLVPDVHRADLFIEALQNSLVLNDLGATFLTGLNGNISIPALESGISAGWIGENANATEGAPVWGERTLSEKTISSYMPLSRKILRQSNPSIENLIRQEMIFAIAQGIQKAALEGSGVGNEPLGLLNLSGVNAVTFAALGNPTFKELVEMETSIDVDNALMGNLSYLSTTAIKGYLKTLKIDAGSGIMALNNNELNGHRFRGINGLTANTAYFGNWRDMLIGQFGSIEVLADRVTRSGQMDISMFADMDVAFRHAQSFVIGNGGV
ncbi:MAG: phage major capsid protein [Candidatus Cloacimonadota bacterium]|nr:MAG: phage major capsid protein [Candidatus Cloacimonadota bacterium]